MYAFIHCSHIYVPSYNLNSIHSFFIDVRVRGCTLLSEIAVSISNVPNAVNLALSALRMLQSCDKDSTQFDPLLWLQTRVALAESMMLLAPPSLHPSLNMSSVCSEGVRESQALGDPEVTAHFLYASGVHHFVSVLPPDLERVRRSVTECLQTLEGCIELSDSGHVLKCKASLLLAEVSFARKEEEKEEGNVKMVAIYRGIGQLLEDQVWAARLCVQYV